METSVNYVTTSELIQIIGIVIGAMAALATLLVGIFIWVANHRDKGNERRHQETGQEVERRHQETMQVVERLNEENERRHQELLKAISLLYRHVHADGSPAIVPLADVDPAAAPAMPAAADD